MGIILNIETATSVCSVALGKDGVVIATKEENQGFSHAEKLTLFIEDVCSQAEIKLSDLDAIAVSSGPGSYTGLRIGVSTAKGLCFALDKPLISVSTLCGIARGIQNRLMELKVPLSEDDILFPMIDARRMEVYRAIYSKHLHEIEGPASQVITNPGFFKGYGANQVYLGGDGCGKFLELFENESNVKILNDVLSSASYLTQESERKFNSGDIEDTSLFEPFYLKEYIPGKPKGQ